MKRPTCLWLGALLGSAGLAAGQPVLAQTASAPVSASLAQARAIAPQAQAQQEGSGASLEDGRKIAAQLWPDGTYAKMMESVMGQITGQVMDSMTALPIRDLAAMSGMPSSQLDKMGKGTLEQILAIQDPAYHQRMKIMMDTMMPELTKVMAQMEPAMREGLAQAYANRFNPQQLADITRFFQTPSGQAYAANAMLVQTDPAMMAKIQGAIPKMMEAMPTIIAKIKAANDTLPAPRKYADLSPADRAKLAGLLGISEKDLAARQAGRK